MLKIIKSSDPITVERINLCIYGPPGIGKSSLAFTTEAPLLLDFDNGAHRATNRKDTVRVIEWSEVTDLKQDDLANYKTVVVDTAGRALDVLTADIIKRNPKAGRGGALTLQGYGSLKAEFVAWLRMLNGFGKDVVLIAHMDEQRNGDDIIERLDVQGGSKGEIYKAADAMGRLSMKAGARLLSFDPTDASFGKNPGQLEAMALPHPDRDPLFMAGVITKIKDKLNTMSSDQVKSQQHAQEWRDIISKLETAKSFNAELPKIKTEVKAIQALFADAAKAKGLTFDKKAGAYQEAVAA